MWRFPFKLRDVLLLGDYGIVGGNWGIPFHNGIDISVGGGEWIGSFVDDVAKVYKINPVIKQDEGTVIIHDVNNVEYVFAHMDNLRVKEGDLVVWGQNLGTQDSKGQSVQSQLRPFWSHLHFAIREIDEINGKYGYWWDYGNKYANVDNGLDGFIDPNKYCERVLKRVALAICKYESGWSFNSLTGEETWHPNVITLKENKNPGGLRWSPLQKGSKNGFAVFETPLGGLKALIWDLEQKALGNTRTKLNGKSTIYEFCKVWAPKEEGNNPFKYAEFLVRECGFMRITDPIGDWLLTELDWVRKYNNVDKQLDAYTKDYWVENPIGLFLNYFWSFARKLKKTTK